MTLYEFNQMGMMNFPKLTEEQLENCKSEFFDWYQNNKQNKYFMLLNKENSYYTIFQIQTSEMLMDVKAMMFKEMVECVKTFGDITDIDYSTSTNKECIEVWIKPTATEEDENPQPIMFLMFPYDEGVIKI